MTSDFVDFQAYAWLAYGDVINLMLFIFVTVSVIVLVVTLIDRVFTQILPGKGGEK